MPYPTLIIGSSNHAAVRVLQADLTRKGFGLAVDGVFGIRTKGQVQRFQARHGLARDGVVGPKTWGFLVQGIPASHPHPAPHPVPHPTPHPKPTPQPSSMTARRMADIAYSWATAGHPYIWGGKAVPLMLVRPSGMDCSGLVEWAVYQASRTSWVAGSRYQAANTRRISVAQAISTKGALLFISSTGTYSGVHHVAVSLGNGRTAEARGVHSNPETGSFTAYGRFNLAGLVPVLRYS